MHYTYLFTFVCSVDQTTSKPAICSRRREHDRSRERAINKNACACRIYDVIQHRTRRRCVKSLLISVAYLKHGQTMLYVIVKYVSLGIFHLSPHLKKDRTNCRCGNVRHGNCMPKALEDGTITNSIE